MLSKYNLKNKYKAKYEATMDSTKMWSDIIYHQGQNTTILQPPQMCQTYAFYSQCKLTQQFFRTLSSFRFYASKHILIKKKKKNHEWVLNCINPLISIIILKHLTKNKKPHNSYLCILYFVLSLNSTVC